MALSAQQKSEVVTEYQRGTGDTGSPEVQVALLTTDIKALSGHFGEHSHDHHSRQGLLRKVNQRREPTYRGLFCFLSIYIGRAAK